MSKIVYIGALHPKNLELMDDTDMARVRRALRNSPDTPDYFVHNHGSNAAGDLKALRDALTDAGFAVTNPGLPKTALRILAPETADATDACRMNWFREKYEKLMKQMQSTGFKAFACDLGVVNALKQTISDDRGNAIWFWTGYGPRVYPLDEFIRKLCPGTAYYIMDRTIYVHN